VNYFKSGFTNLIPEEVDLLENYVLEYGIKSRKIIRCVGNPEKRFQEDALRIMRALRFMAQLNYSLDKETLGAIESTKDLIGNISVERISVEFNKLILENYQSKLHETQLLYLEKEIVLADKVEDVNSKITQIVGLTANDFARSVVLPQDKFNEFLKLTGSERRDISVQLNGFPSIIIPCSCASGVAACNLSGLSLLPLIIRTHLCPLFASLETVL